MLHAGKGIMAGDVRYPSLYQINTRVWLGRLSWQLRKKVTLKEVPDEELDRIAGLGFDWVWLSGRRVR